jgi:hypothetical protein
VVEGVAGGGGDCAVGADLAGGDGEDDAAEGVVAELLTERPVGVGGIAEDAALDVWGEEREMGVGCKEVVGLCRLSGLFRRHVDSARVRWPLKVQIDCRWLWIRECFSPN